MLYRYVGEYRRVKLLCPLLAGRACASSGGTFPVCTNYLVRCKYSSDFTDNISCAGDVGEYRRIENSWLTTGRQGLCEQ